jgi:hypothetical protein
VLLQAFNLNVPSMMVGLLGVRSYLLYSLLLFLLPAALERLHRHERLVTAVVIGLIAPVLILGLYQFYQPLDSWLNQYVATDTNAAKVLNRPRITGTFSYIAGMSEFLIFSVFLGLAISLTGFQYKIQRYQWLGTSLLLLAMIVAPMNGSRSVVYGILLPLPFILYASLQGQNKTRVIIGVVALLTIGSVLVAQSEWTMQGWDTIAYRVENASDQDTRIQTMVLDPLAKISVGGLIGYGTGSTHQAAGILSEQGRVSIPGVYYEIEIGRIIIELGVIGACLYVSLKLLLSWLAWRAMIRAKKPWHNLLSTLSFGYLFTNITPASVIVFNHTAGSLYWICAACAIWVWSRQEFEKWLTIDK